MKRLTFEQLQNIQPGKTYMAELSRLYAGEAEVIYWGRTQFTRQGNLVTPTAIVWMAYDTATAIQETTTNFAPDGGFCFRSSGHQALVFEMPDSTQGRLTFVCPHCGEADRLRKRTRNATFTEFVQVRAGGKIWDIDDMFLEEEGAVSFYCEECGERIRGVHSEQEMAEWILSERMTSKCVTP